MVVIEAENYHSKAHTTLRDFYTFPTTASTPKPDPDGDHTSGPVTPAGNGKYVEILPDTRATAFDDGPLEYNVNIWLAGQGAPRLNYLVKINSPGRYYVWGRAFSTGTEDNGVHVGVNDTWPLSGTALQWCDGKRKWYWSSNRRLPENHCGVRNGTYLDLVAGEHTIMFAQREDGFELDRFLLTKDSSYTPPLEGIGPAESPRTTGGGTTSNTAPSVYAGADATVEVDESANLSGSASDDGRVNTTLTIRWSRISGPGTVTFGSASSLNTTARFSATGSYVLELSAFDGALTSTDRIGISVIADSGDPVAAEFIVFAATANQANVSRGTHSWRGVSLDGAQALQALPDIGTRIASNFTSTSPFLRFNVNFPETGVYYVWLRGNASGNDNSAHVGLNGTAVASATNITLPVNGNWTWGNTLLGGQRATINITSTGTKTLEVYMREDGFALERILLTKSPSYVPSGAVQAN